MKISNKARVVLAVPLLLLSACNNPFAESSASQCLSTFKSTFKDPESGKILSFNEISGVLTYTATNSYGARIQSSALCTKVRDKWYFVKSYD